jgi:hypothetical protein
VRIRTLAAVLALSPLVAFAAGKDEKKPCESAACCPHGALEDPHRGFVRCLEKGEDAGPLPRSTAAPSASASASPAGSVVAELKKVETENGEIPTAEKAVAKMLPSISQCVTEAGGLGAATGSLKVEALVRAKGKAEGVELREQKAIPAAAAKCLRDAVRGKNVGTPTKDPVGLRFVVELKRKG